MPKVVVVIPWREHPSRVYAYNKLLDWYGHYFSDISVISADSDSGKFNVSQAKNNGASQAIAQGADIIVFNDADAFVKPSQLQNAVAHSESFNEIAVAYSEVCQHTNTKDTRIFFKNLYLKSKDRYLGKRYKKPKMLAEGRPDKLYPCGGVLAVPVGIFKNLDGFEENIIGWGPEDTFFHRKYFDFYKKPFVYVEGILHSTYNDPSWRISGKGHNEKYSRLATFLDIRDRALD